MWLRQFGTSGMEWVADVAVDRVGNAYVVGQTTGPLAPRAKAVTRDVFLHKYTAEGFPEWRREFGSQADDTACDLAVDAAGSIYVAGHTNGALPGQIHLGGQDAFVCVYSAAGLALWSRQFGVQTDDQAVTIRVVGDVVRVAGCHDCNISPQAYVATVANKPIGPLRCLRFAWNTGDVAVCLRETYCPAAHGVGAGVATGCRLVGQPRSGVFGESARQARHIIPPTRPTTIHQLHYTLESVSMHIV